jgi:hypothetical protein
MFFQRIFWSKTSGNRTPHKKPERRLRPCLEALEDRFLLAQTYTWSGPAEGLWSLADNWVPNIGPPGPGDTALFNTGASLDNEPFCPLAPLSLYE